MSPSPAVDFNTEALLDPDIYPHPAAAVEHIETHISHIYLTGDFAYKVKKAIKLPFLDFSSLEKRKAACQSELRLNQRFAPELYVDVVPLYFSKGILSLEPEGLPVEYAVKMKQFDNATLLSNVLHEGRFTRELAVGLAESIAEFHKQAESTPDYWGVEAVTRVTSDNLKICQEYSELFPDNSLAQLQQLLTKTIAKHSKLIAQRQKTSVKELHGDLHLKNVCIYNSKPTLFDGIEFNKEYSCCDVWADIAFLIMDLLSRDRVDLGFAVLNRYLELTDDFEGLPLLPLYLSYRAAVRAKVACIRLSENSSNQELPALRKSAAQYVQFALQILSPGDPALIAIGGFSGSGKTTLGRILAEDLGAIHIRSDVTRKHLIGIAPEERAPQIAYSDEMSHRTYLGILQRAKLSAESGFTTIVDAVFSRPQNRIAVEQAATGANAPFTGIWCDLDREVATERISQRTNDASDATSADLDRQHCRGKGELTWLVVNTNEDPETVAEKVKKHLPASN